MATGVRGYLQRIRLTAEFTGKSLKPTAQWLPAGIIGHRVIAFLLVVIVNLANATTAVGGIAVAILVRAGFIVTPEVGELI